MAREGQDVLAGSPLIHPDRWSWAPQPWDFIPTSPAWELMSGLFWGIGGTWGLFALTALTVAASLGALAWMSRSLGASPTATVVAVLTTATLAAGIVTARAGLPAFLLLLVEFVVCWNLRAQIREVRFAKALIGLLSATFAWSFVGVWLHGSWSLYSVMAAAGLAFLFVNREFGPGRRRAGLAGAAALGSLLGACAGPLGPGVWANTLRVSRECSGLVKEWTSPWKIDGVWVCILCIGVVIAISLVASAFRHRRTDSVFRPESLFLMASVGGIAAGATAIRFLLLGLIAATPLIAQRLTIGSIADSTQKLRDRLGERAHEPYWRNVVALLAAAALPLCAIQAAATPRGPDAAISALPQGCNLFADDWVTKPVELWRPDVRVWIDGRQDYWGRQRLLLSNRYLAAEVQGRLVPNGTTCVLLETGANKRLAQRLDDSSTWHRTARTDAFTVWVR